MNSEELIYEDNQHLNMWWVWLIVILLTIFMWYSAIMQLIFNTPIGTNPGSDTFIFIFWLLFGVLFPIFIATCNMLIKVDNKCIKIVSGNRLLFNRTIMLNNISKAEIKTYNPLKEYGGWGNRGFGKNKAYTVSGNRGLQLTLIDESKVLIGSNDPESLLEIIKTMIN
ncbi:MAG: hypothetical protein KAH01_05815 [Caldisericia bacterium]|nr:hypothetical protein [Caldisericia bacterium]